MCDNDKKILEKAEEIMNCKIIAVPKEAKFVLTVTETEDGLCSVDLANMTEELNQEETYDMLLSLQNEMANFIGILLDEFDFRKEAKKKEQDKKQLKIIKGGK